MRNRFKMIIANIRHSRWIRMNGDIAQVSNLTPWSEQKSSVLNWRKWCKHLNRSSLNWSILPQQTYCIHIPRTTEILTRLGPHWLPLFFANWTIFLIGKQFNFDNATSLIVQEFIDSCPPDFYNTGLNNLLLRLQKCIDNMNGYFGE